MVRGCYRFGFLRTVVDRCSGLAGRHDKKRIRTARTGRDISDRYVAETLCVVEVVSNKATVACIAGGAPDRNGLGRKHPI